MKSNNYFLSAFIFLFFIMGCDQSGNNKISLAEIDTMPLIDVHCHAEMPGAYNTDNVIKLILQEKMNYVLMLCTKYDELIDKVKPYKDKIGVMLYFVPEMKNRYKILDSVTLANKDLVRGYKLHPSAYKHEITVALLDSLFMLANKYNLLIVTHTDSAWSQASKYKPLLEKYPDTKLILYHAAPAQEAFDLVNKYKNVYIDVSFTAWGKDFQQKALKAVGKDKILFGIDSPLGFPEDSSGLKPHFRQAAKEVAAFYNFDREVVEAVLYKNAAKLLDLNIK
jgi:predicted TIM-barrel fold metal-dependent hydrolase